MGEQMPSIRKTDIKDRTNSYSGFRPLTEKERNEFMTSLDTESLRKLDQLGDKKAAALLAAIDAAGKSAA